MTNSIALALAILLIGFFALDYFVLDWDLPVFLARRLAQLSDWIAFWR